VPDHELNPEHGPAREVVELLLGADVEFELLPHRRTLSAAGEARALAVPTERTAKTVVTRVADGRCVRAVVPASTRLSLEKLGRVVHGEPQLLTEPELDGAYPQFELGAVPPFAGPMGDRVVVDKRLAEADHVVLEAGAHELSIRLRPADLVRITAAEIADIATG